MNIFPATDIIGGRAVRLTQGDYNAVTNYDLTPLDAALGFAADGASFLHIVDLDGAKNGQMSNFEVIKEIVEKTKMFVEVGGGIRDMKRIESYLECGAARVILGTAVIKSPSFLVEAVKEFGERIVVGVDTKGEKIAVDGWKTVTDIDGIDYLRTLPELGVKTVIYTPIECDGMLSGTSIETFERLAEISNLDIVASGGISSIIELKKLKELGISAAILGKALYEKKLNLKEVLEQV